MRLPELSLMQSDEPVTFTVIRGSSDGRRALSGAHAPILIRHQATGECELVNTPGTWLGDIPDIGRANRDMALALACGAGIVLYSEGVIEATRPSKAQQGWGASRRR